MGRSSSGVIGINLDGGKVVGCSTSTEGQYILSLTTKGFGKMSLSDDYRLTSRGGKGVLTLNATDRVGDLAVMRAVEGNEDILITTNKGVIIRTSLSQVKVAGRNTQGVKIIRLDEDQTISSIAVTEAAEEETADTPNEETNLGENVQNNEIDLSNFEKELQEMDSKRKPELVQHRTIKSNEMRKCQ